MVTSYDLAVTGQVGSQRRKEAGHGLGTAGLVGHPIRGCEGSGPDAETGGAQMSSSPGAASLSLCLPLPTSPFCAPLQFAL